MESTSKCIGVKTLDIPAHRAPTEAFRKSTHHSTGLEPQCRKCKANYNTAYTRGKLNVNSRSKSLVGRFLKALEASPEAALEVLRGESTLTESGCWEWGMSTASGGYGTFRVSRANRPKNLPQFTLVHRWAFWLSTGEVTTDTIHHKCSNRICFNPEHLEKATLRNNIGEMFARKSYEKRITYLENKVQQLELEVGQLKGKANSYFS